jgi:hypothetical protein
MSRYSRILGALAVVAVGLGSSSGQQRVLPRTNLPAEIFDNTSVDVARIAPHLYAVEMANQFNHVRVMRAHIGAGVRVPTHHHNAGLIVALTPISLRFTATDGSPRDIQLPAGATRWVEDAIHSETNLTAAPCEFLFIETDYTGKPY